MQNQRNYVKLPSSVLEVVFAHSQPRKKVKMAVGQNVESDQ